MALLLRRQNVQILTYFPPSSPFLLSQHGQHLSVISPQEGHLESLLQTPPCWSPWSMQIGSALKQNAPKALFWTATMQRWPSFIAQRLQHAISYWPVISTQLGSFARFIRQSASIVALSDAVRKQELPLICRLRRIWQAPSSSRHFTSSTCKN